MRLVMLGPYPIDSNVNNIKGGVQATIVNMVKGLSKFKDLELHIVTASHDIDGDVDFKSNNLYVHAVSSDRHFGNITLYRRARKRISNKIREISSDLVHTHMFGYYTLAALESGHKKIVVSSHGIPDKNWMASRGIISKIRNNRRHSIYKRCMRKVKHVIVNSPYTKERLRELRDKNVYQLNNPISEAFFGIDSLSEERQRLLFVGNVSEEKGIMMALNSLKMLKESFSEIEFAMAGPIVNADFYSMMSRFLKESGLGGSAHFLGHLGEERLREEYAKASVFVFPSRQDVAPLALLQAMAAGKAIVATRVGGIPYIVDDGINGFLVDKGDSFMLSQKIALFIKDSALRKRFGLSAKRKASEGCSIDKVAEGLRKIYSEVIR